MEINVKTNERHLVSDMSKKSIDTDANVKSRTPIEPLMCNGCGMEFPEICLLNRQFCSNLNDQSYSCNICSKQFVDKIHVNQHYRTLTNEKLYSCDVCGKEFSQKDNLDIHYRIHTKDKLYSCDTCGKEFSRKVHLDRHYRIHTNAKPYSCDVCSKEFSQKVEPITRKKPRLLQRIFPVHCLLRMLFPLQELEIPFAPVLSA
ncbi:Zinc finger protein 235 [Araneus ventricosus]|uniref:Zinc finger protein 235 n=1 Tax=Araneus ventricosus TaxID=182803 RepID=A0A4Y2IDC7_ARAVE|nr:Zinc finger protein 235 [Araneus ventricosus]